MVKVGGADLFPHQLVCKAGSSGMRVNKEGRKGSIRIWVRGGDGDGDGGAAGERGKGRSKVKVG